MNITDLVLEQRANLFRALQATGIPSERLIEKIDKRYPFGNWKHPVEVWLRPIISSEKGLHLANYWLSFPRKGKGKTVKFNLTTFESIAKWLNQPKLLQSPPDPSTTAADSSQS